MDFQSYVDSIWNEHGENTEDVARRLPDGIPLVESPAQGVQLTKAIFHVLAAHLGRIEEAAAMCAQVQRKLESMGQPELSGQTDLLVAALHSVAGRTREAESRLLEALRLGSESASRGFSEASFRARMNTLAAEAFLGLHNPAEAYRHLAEASHLAASLPKDDTAVRAVAVTSNNLAWEFLEKRETSLHDAEFMTLAAETSLLYWRVAGGWREVALAHSLLVRVFAKRHMAEEAMAHASECSRLCDTHGQGPSDALLAQEALAWAYTAQPQAQDEVRNAVERVRTLFEQLPDEEKPFYREGLQSLDLQLGRV